MTTTRFDFRTYVFENTGAVVMLIAVYVSVLCIGMFCASEIGYDKCEQLMLFYENAADAASGTNVDFETFFKTTLGVNLKYMFMVFVSGFLIPGMIFVVLVFALKVFYLGLALGCIYTVCGGEGFLFSIRTVILQNLLSLPLIIIYAAVCIKFSYEILKNVGMLKRENDSVKRYMSYTAMFVIFVMLMCACSFVECFAVMISS